MMELKMNAVTYPQAITFNFDELKNEIAEKVNVYSSMVYTEDQLKSAKADRASLNKFVDALESKRKEVKKQCLAPYEDFETKMKELVSIVKEPIRLIDEQVKGFEELQKKEKTKEIKAYFDSVWDVEGIIFEQIFESKWLNASVKLKAVQDAIDTKQAEIKESIDMLSKLPEFGFEAVQCYKLTLNVAKAVDEAKKMAQIARAKAEAEFVKNMNPPTPNAEADEIADIQKQIVEASEEPKEPQEKEWVAFKAFLSMEDALALRDFFNSRSIEFEAV